MAAPFSAFGAGALYAILTDKFLCTQVIGGMLFSKKHPDAHGDLRCVNT